MAKEVKSAFDAITEEELNKHLSIGEYNDLLLTEAIRPSCAPKITLREGYSFCTIEDADEQTEAPGIIAAVSRDRLFQVFMDMVDCLDDELNVWTYFSENVNPNEIFARKEIEKIVLQSHLYAFEDLIVNSGFTRVDVENTKPWKKVILDDHKLLFVAHPMVPQQTRVLREYGIMQYEHIDTVIDDEHIHLSAEEHETQFQEFVTALDAEEI